jgi:hypothetical protein
LDLRSSLKPILLIKSDGMSRVSFLMLLDHAKTGSGFAESVRGALATEGCGLNGQRQGGATGDHAGIRTLNISN